MGKIKLKVTPDCYTLIYFADIFGVTRETIENKLERAEIVPKRMAAGKTKPVRYLDKEQAEAFTKFLKSVEAWRIRPGRGRKHKKGKK